jgi:hypothetical protein
MFGVHCQVCGFAIIGYLKSLFLDSDGRCSVWVINGGGRVAIFFINEKN